VKLGLVSFTARGRALVQRLADGYSQSDKVELVLWDKSRTSLKTFVADHFRSLDGFVFIGAIGIAVRLTAPYIESKAQDPAVVVLDEAGHYVIPVLSGHLGGANNLAQDIGRLIGAEPVITTSTDVHGIFAVDIWSKRRGCEILEIDRIKHISGALLDGQPVGLVSDFEIGGKLPAGLTPSVSGSVGFCVSLSEQKQPFEVTLHIVPKCVTLGIGCRRGTAFEDLERFIIETLAEKDISLKAVAALHSIDLKKNEPCLHRFSEIYGIPFKTFSAGELMAVQGTFERSAFVESITGVDNVCERSAMATDQGDRLGSGTEFDLVSDTEFSLVSDTEFNLGTDTESNLGTDSKLNLKTDISRVNAGGALANSRCLIITKRQKSGMTLAAAIEDWRCEF
jgi:cobalt-precorrin 5A hydrolase